MYNRIKEVEYKKIIKIPEGAEIEINNNFYYIKGPKGSIKQKINKNIEIEKIAKELIISIKNKNLKRRDLYKIIPSVNTTGVLIKNFLNGVINHYTYVLNIKGIGYKAKYDTKTSKLQLNLGFSHTIEMEIPRNVEIEIIDSVNILIKGSSKQEIGQLSSEIKNKKPAEIYKGNGIKYKDEIIKLKSPKKKQK